MSTRDISSCKENIKERRWDVNFEYTYISSNSASNLVVNKSLRQIVTMNLNICLISKLKIKQFYIHYSISSRFMHQIKICYLKCLFF